MRLPKLYFIIMVTLLFSGCTQILVETLNHIETTKIRIQNDKMYLLGDFNTKSYAQITKALRTHPKVKTLVLTASSGSLDDNTTFKLARYVRSKGLNTHLLSNSVIASGAVDFFLAGKQRTLEKGARLGVHSWSDGSTQAKDIARSDPDHQLNANYIKDMLGNDAFYWFTIYAAPADTVHWMSDAEIQRFKLITKTMANSYDKTPFGTLFQEERQSILED